jgi:hypothetical protein
VSQATDSPADRRLAESGIDNALLCFVLVAIGAGLWYLYIGRRQWFSYDEWDFIAARNAGHLSDLLRPHPDTHWSTMPILLWRGLWRVFGLRYFPYQVITVCLHLTIAALLRVVMRRAGVSPWISTIAATTFVLFGYGAYNIIYAFQANFDGALVFGLIYLLLADHDGPFDKRDWLGMLAGLCAFMCSEPAVTLIAVVGIATFIRRGFISAAMHSLPLAAVFVAWWFRYARSETSMHVSLASNTRFVRHGLQATFGAITEIPGMGDREGNGPVRRRGAARASGPHQSSTPRLRRS